jgi:small subunit ribosomal protein S2
MDWWLILLIILVIVLIVWWALSRQTTEEEGDAGHHEDPVPAAAPTVEDDLTKIEGIGPKVEQLLKDAGIKTYTALAEKTPEELDAIMDAAGSIYKAMDETSWPKQAGLAAAGDWDALQKLQDELVGGRE